MSILSKTHRTPLFATLFCLLGCNNQVPGPYIDPPPPDAGPPDLTMQLRPTRLIIDPGGARRLTVEGGVAASTSWRAYLHFDDTGEDKDVSDTCFWSLVAREGQRTPLGTIDRGRFTSTLFSSGAGTVRAELSGMRAEAEVSLRLIATRLSTTDDGSAPPEDAAARFSGVNVVGRSPRALYPPPGAVLPANLGGLRVQWAAQGGTNLHEVRILADLLDLRIYTTSSRRLSLSEADYTLLSDAGLYGEVKLEVRGTVLGGDGSYGTSATIPLRAATAAQGASYYFATARVGGAQGLWRHSWQAPFGAAATAYLTTESAVTGRRCVGCHSVSRDGGFLVVAHDGELAAPLVSGSFLDVKTGQLRFANPALRWLSSSLSGSGTDVILAGQGLTALKTAEGTNGVAVPTGVPGGRIAVMPAQSADGQRLLFVRGTPIVARSEAHITNGSIVQLQKQNNVYGQPTDLVAAVGSDNNYYPALSPDGKWVVYNRATGDSYDNVGAQLYAVPVDGSRPPVRLTQANDTFTQVAAPNAAVRLNLSNSFPTFLPEAATLDGRQVFFFVFASRRDYGVEVVRNGAGPRAPNTTTVLGQPAVTGWNQQLWVSVFDPDKAAAGVDPSAAALWLPFQSQLSSNHTPVSTQTVVGPDL